MLLSEESLRRLIRNIILEAPVMRRRGGEMTRIPDKEETKSRTPDVGMQVRRSQALSLERPITDISDITISDSDISRISPESPFVGGSKLFHELYNYGLSEEMRRLKVPSKDPGAEDKTIFVLADYTIKAGALVSIPELFEAGKYGVATVAEVITKGRYPLHVPVAMLDFPDGQRPPGIPSRCNNVGVAFLVKVKPDDAREMRISFEAENRKKQNAARLSGGMTTVRYGR